MTLRDFSFKDKIYLVPIIFLILFLIMFSIFNGLFDNDFTRIFKGNDFKYYYEYAKDITSNDFYKKDINNKIKNFYSPILYYLYFPLTLLPYSIGLILNSVFFMCLYLTSIIFLIKTFKRIEKYFFYVILFSLLYPPFIYVSVIGQISILWVFILSLSFYMAKKDRVFVSGLILSLIIMNINFFIIVLVILLFSFRPRIFLGYLTGALALIVISGIWNMFILWSDCVLHNVSIFLQIFNFNQIDYIRNSTIRTFFYPLYDKNFIIHLIGYIFILIGLFAIIPPIIYSFFHKKNFSRNSFWLMLSISLVLSNFNLFNYDLVILLFPLIIFTNLLLADRVQNKYVLLISVTFFIWITCLYLISMFIFVQIFAVMLWFFLINAMFAKRVRNYTPKKFIGYWDEEYH